ncbi:MFS transporter [uncultured Desulfosarcina sp.]|uniref:MFS transporter n=1 Tax=uncultured Desulfosarcina sp. TaxID=218289 RepID=UPI0029C73A0D|nr:MFS transporter [uncultured Desulfosarcina sp.]
MRTGNGKSRNRFNALPPGIWALGGVSLLMDISSELIHSLLPVFMATTLGVSMTAIGIIEGIAEASAAITKVFSGTISDYLGKRKLLAVIGYGLGAVTKPVFPLAATIGWVFGARFVDRIGKGIRGAPRDALVADIVPGDQRGAAYGLRQALDSVGAFLGPLCAVALMAWFANNIRAVLWVAVIPAFMAVGLLVFGVREPDKAKTGAGLRNPVSLNIARRLPARYWLIVLLGAVFTLARFSEAFLVLRAQSVGLALGYVPLMMVVMNVVYAASAYPAGILADRVNSRPLLILGLAVLVVADVVLAAAASPLVTFIGAALWGLHMGLTQGLFAKLVADTAPSALRGTAFGIFNLVTGIALLMASVIAGVLWSVWGASATFIAGAAFAAFALMGVTLYRRTSQPV